MKRKIGKGIIIVGFIISLNAFILALMVPVVIIGIILIWWDRKSVSDSLIWSIWPFMLWYPIFLMLTSLSSSIAEAKSQKFDLIFPKNFTGEALVLSDSKCGQSKIIKEGREQLFIPSNGVLLYKGTIEQYGLINHHHYYQFAYDSLKLIPRRNDKGMFWDMSNNKPPSDLIVVWVSVPAPKSIEGYDSTFQSLYIRIGSIDSLNIQERLKLNKKIDSTAYKLIKECYE